MSNNSDKENEKNNKMINRRVTMSPKDTRNSSYVEDINKNFDCLRISILNKASRVSGEFNKVTLGPDADHKNGLDSNNVNEDESKTKKPAANGTLSPRSNITFSIKKILLENEVQRREKVKKAVEKKKQEMERSQRQIQEELSELLSKMSVQREKETAEKLAQLEAEEEQIAQQQEMDRKKEIQRKKQVENEEILKKIAPFRENFNSKWKDIANISLACRDKHSAARLLGVHSNKLSALSVQMEAINTKARNGDLTPTDIKVAEIIAQCSGEVYQLFKADIDQIEALYDQEIARREQEVKQAALAAQEEALKIKQMQEMQNSPKVPEQSAPVQQEIKYEQQRQQQQQQQHQQQQHQQQQQLQHQQQQQLQQHQLQQQQQQPQQSVIQNQQVTEVDNAKPLLQSPQNTNAPPASVAPPNQAPAVKRTEVTADQYPDTECLQIYVNSVQFLQHYTAKYQNFIKSDSMKKLRFELQKTLNITINSISLVSREQLIDKYNKLKTFLSGKGSINILQDPQIESYSKNLLAQKIVDQGDTSKLELAFPFGAIAVALWSDFPDFGELLLARFRTKSPFFVPVFLMQRNDQSEDDYYKMLGCKYNENGTPEKHDQFLKRLGGTMYLYASILVTKQRQGINKPHPHGLGNAWRWLAATINIEPRCDTADICATLIYVMLEVTGHELWQTYPNQFPKMLAMLYNVYFTKLKGFNSIVSAPISRLGEFLAKAIQTGSIPAPKKQIPANFW